MSKVPTHYDSVEELYSSVVDSPKLVLVAPRIRRSYPLTDYLYALYRDIFERPTGSNNLTILDLSPVGHFRMIYHALTSRETVILHYHWFEFQGLKQLLALPYKLLCISIFSFLNTRIVWTVHNLQPHDQKYLRLHLILHQWLAKKADKLHLHSPSLLDRSSDYLKIASNSAKWGILEHPEFPSKQIPKSEALAHINSLFKLNIPSNELLLLLFGNISEYKGIDSFISLSKSIPTSFHVLIAGPIKIGQQHTHQKILDAIGSDSDRYHYHPYFIEEKHYSYLLSSADYCVFNYKDILSSGGAAMAKSYNKAIIAPRIGMFRDLEDKPNVLLFSSEHELKSILKQINNP